VDVAADLAEGLSVMLTFITPETASSGHMIQQDGECFIARDNLNFVGFDVSDDAGNDATVITLLVAVPPSLKILTNTNFI
jgi:hypothetical protein